MGWEEKELVFYGLGEKEWKEHVELPKPLTERAWKYLLPKLTPLLESNRARIQEEERLARWFSRRCKIHDLIRRLNHEMHPYRDILDALGVVAPDSLNLPATVQEPLPNPFPPAVALEWDLLKDIYEQDISLERVEELFDERRAQLNQKMGEWRAEKEAQLVERYGGAKLNDRDDVTVLIRGSTDTTQHLSRNVRFLLRADTVFIRQGSTSFSPCVGHFPSAALPVGGDLFDPFGENSLKNGLMEDYSRNERLEGIVKALLRDIWMPDAAHVELQLMGSRFKCGRCNAFPMSWDVMVQHYHNALTSWAMREGFLPPQKTRYPVMFRNIHDINSVTNLKPLAHILSAAEAAENASMGSGLASLFAYNPNSLICKLCSIICDTPTFTSLPQMRMHMQDMHDIAREPIDGIHYAGGTSSIFPPGSVMNDAQWRMEWDSLHDDQVWRDATGIAPGLGDCSTAAVTGLYAL